MIFVGSLLAAMATGPALPPDAAKWVKRYDECEHWLGEEPYDAKRRREIDKAIKRLCTGLNKQRASRGTTVVSKLTGSLIAANIRALAS